MNNFQKAQAAKILATYIDSSEFDDIEKAHPEGYINKYGKQKQADGSWKYVGKNKANQATSESAGEAKPKKTQASAAKKLQGIDPKDFVESIKKDKADGKHPLGFAKIDNPSSPLHGQYFKIASVGQSGTVIYAGGKKVKLTADDKISDRLTATNILNKEKEAGVQKQQEAQNKNKLADIKKLGTELDKKGIAYKVKPDGQSIQIQRTPESFVTIFSRGDGSYVVNSTSGTIENPSKAGNATWYGDTPYSLNTILDGYGKKQAAPAKPSKPKAPAKIKKFTEDGIGAELKKLLVSGMKITDVDVESDGKSFRAYIETGLRGPRIDHGGGEDGDDWLSDEEVEELRQSYEKKVGPALDKIKKELGSRFKGRLRGGVDYGEKGHVGIGLYGKLD